MMMGELPVVSLPQYEGPLDLLLDLVRKRQLDILDLPIAEVTRQYLDYLHRARELNVDLGADFILMAAILILIKSRNLLRPELEREPDPWQELVEQLLTREQAQHAAAFLAEKLQATSDAWPAPVPGGQINRVCELEIRPEPAEPTYGRPGTMNLREVLHIAKTALATAKAHRLLSLKREPVTVEDLIQWVGQRLEQLSEQQFLTSTDLFTAQATVEGRAALFLAILEMARTQHLRLHQEEWLAPIYIAAGLQSVTSSKTDIVR
jgi:segregation and condensation protein A